MLQPIVHRFWPYAIGILLLGSFLAISGADPDPAAAKRRKIAETISVTLTLDPITTRVAVAVTETKKSFLTVSFATLIFSTQSATAPTVTVTVPATTVIVNGPPVTATVAVATVTTTVSGPTVTTTVTASRTGPVTLVEPPVPGAP